MTGVRVSGISTVPEGPSSHLYCCHSWRGSIVDGDKAKGAARAVFLPLARFYRRGAAHLAVFEPRTLQGAVLRPFGLAFDEKGQASQRSHRVLLENFDFLLEDGNHVEHFLEFEEKVEQLCPNAGLSNVKGDYEEDLVFLSDNILNYVTDGVVGGC